MVNLFCTPVPLFSVIPISTREDIYTYILPIRVREAEKQGTGVQKGGTTATGPPNRLVCYPWVRVPGRFSRCANIPPMTEIRIPAAHMVRLPDSVREDIRRYGESLTEAERRVLRVDKGGALFRLAQHAVRRLTPTDAKTHGVSPKH